MADERVMVNSDIYSLTNGMRRPLFLSFSCSVGDLDSPYHRSMAQNMTTYDAGGAIGTIAAAAPTYLYPERSAQRSDLCEHIHLEGQHGNETLGYALQLAKYAVVSRYGYESNNTKYMLLGDPAMRLAAPSYGVEHETAGIDTMRTGERYRVAGSVTAGGRVLSSFNGTADVVVQEAEYKIVESCRRIPSSSTTLSPARSSSGGRWTSSRGGSPIEFVVPRRCHIGPDARIRSYVSSPGIDGVGACDTLRIIQAEAPRPDLEPPSVHVYFSGQATKVKAGARLIADISDPDGIAILGTRTPELDLPRVRRERFSGLRDRFLRLRPRLLDIGTGRVCALRRLRAGASHGHDQGIRQSRARLIRYPSVRNRRGGAL